jgi:uncharacterized protein
VLPLLPFSDSCALSVLLTALCYGLVRALGLNERQQRIAAAFFGAILLAQAAALFAWSRGHALGVTVAWTLIPILASVLLALPLAFVVRHAPRLARRKGATAAEAQGPLLTRRAALALPVFAGAGATIGFTHSERGAELREIGVAAAGLHPNLHGLRILQLSDLHLGTGLDTKDLKLILDRAAPLRPDLVVLTGDVADKLDALTAALPLFTRLAPPLGTYAVLGNHEYMSGVLDRMIAAYADSSVTLLVNETRTLRVGGAQLSLIGIDDPYGKNESGFFDRCLFECDPGTNAAFRLLLSHRPDALDAAAARGIDLVLSGHTHGGQIGWWGRSLFERLGLAQRMWGMYRLGSTQLYTSAGAGDWFPFRINCPREAPLLTLISERKDR